MRKVTGALILLASLAGCNSQNQPSPKNAQAIPVVAAVPALKDLPVYVECVGTLHPSVAMDIRPKVNGTIAAVCVAEGQWVEAGTPLFRINPASYAIKVQEAEAQLSIDQAVCNAAKKKLERYRALAKKDLIAQTEWDDLEKEVTIGLSRLKGDLALVETAKLNLDDCTIASPVKGRVGKLDIHPGAIVSANQTAPLVSISKMDPLIVEFHLTEKEYAALPQPNQALLIGLLNGDDKQMAQGKITFVDNHYDCKSGLLLIRASLPNPQTAYRPGQYVRVRIPVSTLEKALLIPQRAIKYSQEGPYIYIVKDDDIAEMRLVRLGSTFGEEVAIAEGLNPEEKVIIEGHLRIFPGSKVKL